MKTILLVDDNEIEHFLNTEIINDFDPEIEILTSYDGQEALELLRELEEHPDAILLDINMPRMNGHEFLKAYVEEFGASGKPPVVVMLTTSGQERDKEQTAEYECVKDYFVKPLTPEYLETLSKIHGSNK